MIKKHKFNILAFIFSSFYLIYKKASLSYILLFLFLPWLITFAFLWTDLHVGILFFISFIISHISAGFFANFLINKNQKKYQLNTNKNIIPEYYNIPSTKLLLFSLITLGLFDIYWAYKQWSAYNKFSKEEFNPLLRGIFIDFTIYSLIKKITKNRIIKIYALLYMIVNITLFIYYYNNLSVTLLQKFIEIGVSLFSSFLLFFIQKHINRTQKECNNNTSNWELFWLLFGFIISIIYLYKFFEPHLLFIYI